MQASQDRLVPPGALLWENRVEAFAALAKVPERIGADRDRPIHPGDDPAGVETIGTIPEGHFGEIGQAAVLELRPLVMECFMRDAETTKLRGEMVLADRAKEPWLDRAAMFGHLG